MNIVVTNMCQDGNRGDLAILAGTIRALKRAAPAAQITVAPMEVSKPEALAREQADSAKLSDTPLLPATTPARRADRTPWRRWAPRLLRAIGSERARLPWLGSQADREFRARLAEADLVVAKGGSWLFSYREVQQAIFTLRMLHPLRVAQSVGTPSVVLGTSLGPWQRYNRRAYERTLGRCDSLIVRERLSHDYARLHQLDNVILGVDMAFALYDGAAGQGSREGVAITPRRLPYESDAAVERYERAVVLAARALIDDHGQNCYFITQVDLDLPLCEKLARTVNRPGAVRVVSDVDQMTLSELMAWYGERRLLIGTRVHSVIMAAMASTPSVILECDPPKMVGISEQLGLGSWRLQAGTDEINGLPTLAAEALAQVERTASELSRRMQDLADQAFDQVAQVVARVGSA